MAVSVTENPFDPAARLAAFSAKADGAGAIVSFTGHVRPCGENGAVSYLHLEHFPSLTEHGIQDASDEAAARWKLVSTDIVHRVGALSPGEPIVFVAAAAAHRRDAFEAADFLMDFLKTDAMFWKKEVGFDGSKWIEPRAADYQDRERWRRQGNEK